ncbi:uncharacterized protein LOC112561475 [Pomacea canaliculata]|uniref:uncharacterized protein LOC112561475 n=1 Tax=Pomacea canaliculata TaxID=400727 RepID=UPI000D72FDAD|nr:uncharacterized protein LOC112561475 [Pomacea canaliculata]
MPPGDISTIGATTSLTLHYHVTPLTIKGRHFFVQTGSSHRQLPPQLLLSSLVNDPHSHEVAGADSGVGRSKHVGSCYRRTRLACHQFRDDAGPPTTDNRHVCPRPHCCCSPERCHVLSRQLAGQSAGYRSCCRPGPSGSCSWHRVQTGQLCDSRHQHTRRQHCAIHHGYSHQRCLYYNIKSHRGLPVVTTMDSSPLLRSSS